MRRLGGTLLVLVLAGCSYAKQKEPLVVPQSTFTQAELTFPSVYSKVFSASCTSCHGNSGGVNLESYASIKANLDKVYQAAVTARTMPKSPAAPLSSYQLGLLKAWIDAGAPENGTIDTSPLVATFDSIKSHILTPKCLMCHSPGKPVERIPLVTLADLLNSPLDLVLPGDADESGIVLSITSADPNKIMPAAKDASGQPTGFSHLTDEEIQIIKDWINRGAKD